MPSSHCDRLWQKGSPRPYARHAQRGVLPEMATAALNDNKARATMKMILTAGALCAALLMFAVSAVNAKTNGPHGQNVTPATLASE